MKPQLKLHKINSKQEDAPSFETEADME